MIEVNLLPGKKAFKLPVVLGIDLALFNFKFIGIALLIHIILVPYMKSDGEEQLAKETEGLEKLRGDLRKAEVEGQASKEIEKEVEKLNEQEKKLQEKLGIVRQIIKIKKNPLGILLYLSKHIPADVWLTGLTLDNDAIILEGGASSYRSIGIFIENLQGAIFFGNTIKLDDSRTVTNAKSKKRQEMFKISATIMRYE